MIPCSKQNSDTSLIISSIQDDCNGAVANKLHSVKPVLGDWQSSYRRCRKDEVVLCRARIGHTYMTHSYIIKKYPPPQFDILVECNRLAQTRNGRCGVVESLQFHPELVLICFNDILIFIQNVNSIKL